ncbi:MAG TPA: aminoacyl-tRNA deacylase [Solirubrobacteraceae bacterium]|jgi:Cys-tRNA(Pro)/Cys-tRNA(Cys) deacylase
MAGKQTPATRAAASAGISFTLHEYAHDPGTDSYALEAASALSLDADRVFKTLVVTADKGLIVCLIPAAASLVLRSLGKHAALAPVARAESVTGYVAGGISPLGQRRRLPTFIDEAALRFDTVFVSAGRRGLELELEPQDLVTATGATVRRLRRDPGGDAETHGRFPSGHPHQP